MNRLSFPAETIWIDYRETGILSALLLQRRISGEGRGVYLDPSGSPAEMFLIFRIKLRDKNGERSSFPY